MFVKISKVPQQVKKDGLVAEKHPEAAALWVSELVCSTSGFRYVYIYYFMDCTKILGAS